MGFMDQFFRPVSGFPQLSRQITSPTGREIGRSESNPLAPEFHDVTTMRPRFGENEYINVSSSWIAALKWEEKTQTTSTWDEATGQMVTRILTTNLGTVRMALRDGHILSYEDIPRDVYRDWLRASSKGEFYGRYIKGQFTYLGKV